jgi:hypothetical protein
MSLEARFHDNCFREVATVKNGHIQIKTGCQNKIKWFRDSPDAGDPRCICSVCGKQIGEEECPIRFFNQGDAA